MNRTAELRYSAKVIGHDSRAERQARCIHAAAHSRRTLKTSYRKLYGRTATGNPLEAINWRLVVSTDAPSSLTSILARTTSPVPSQTPSREPAEFTCRSAPDLSMFPVYDRYQVARGAQFAGPAIVEERESTFVIGEAP